MRALVDLAKVLGKPEPTVELAGKAVPAAELADKLRSAIRAAAFDGDKFLSGADKQLSWASNAWAVLADVTDSQAEAQKALLAAYETDGAIAGNTPYLHHYVRSTLSISLGDALEPC